MCIMPFNLELVVLYEVIGCEQITACLLSWRISLLPGQTRYSWEKIQ